MLKHYTNRKWQGKKQLKNKNTNVRITVMGKTTMDMKNNKNLAVTRIPSENTDLE